MALGVLVFGASALYANGAPTGARALITMVRNPETGLNARVAAGEVIVEFVPGAGAVDKSAVAAGLGAALRPSRRGNQRHVLELPGDLNPFTAADELQHDPRVMRAYPNGIGTFATVPDEPELGAWWFLAPAPDFGVPPESRSIALTEFWTAYDGTDHTSVVVVLFDSGLDIAHEEFADEVADDDHQNRRIHLFPSFIPQQYVGQADRDPDPPDGFTEYTSPRDFFGHGTNMAGLIGAIDDNNEAVAGVAHDNPLWIFKIGQVGAGGGDIRFDDVIDAMEFLEDQITANPGLRFVANMSIGLTYNEIGAGGVATFQDHVSSLEATDKCLIVASTGNDEDVFWTDDPFTGCERTKTPTWRTVYPAAFSGAYNEESSNVIAVGASRLIVDYGNDQCSCGGPRSAAVLRAWGEYSCYLGPNPSEEQPECVPIVDILAPGGARKAVAPSELTCDSLNVLTTDLHTQGSPAKTKWSWGTSNSAALVTGVIAGAWSRDITMLPGELKSLVKAYADRSLYNVEDGISGNAFNFTTQAFCLDPPSPGEFGFASLSPGDNEVVESSLKVGAGVLNAGRVIEHTSERVVDYVTSGTISQNTTITSDGILVLSGDLTVAQGVTLTLGRADESLQPIKVETTGGGVLVLVEGTLALQGPVSFATYDKGTQEAAWQGIEVASGGSIVTNGHSLTVRNAATALTMTGSGQSLELVAEYCTNGLVLNGYATLGEGSTLSSISGVAVDAVDADVRISGGFEVTAGPGLAIDAANDRLALEGGLSTTEPLTFTSRLASPAAGDWAGMLINGSFSSAGPWTIEYAGCGIQHAGTVTLSNMTFQDCMIGIVANGISGALTLTDSSFDTMGLWGLSRGSGGALSLGDVSFSHVDEAAIEMNGGVLTVTDPVTVDDCGGVNLTNLSAGSGVEDVTITNSTGVALAVAGGSLSLGPNVVVDESGAGMPGIQITGGASVTLAGSVSAQHCALHGVLVIESTLTGTWEDLVARYNGSAGLRVEDGAVSLGSGTVLSNNASGLYLLDTEATAVGASMESNTGSGVVVEGTSDVDAANCFIRSNSTGVLVADQATATLGTSCGHNSFAGNSYKHVVNLNTGQTVSAVGNYWGACPAKATKFTGTVNYEGCLFCEDEQCPGNLEECQ